jgi:light-harvesting complex II chlorophyll a/b binding protein 2
MAAATACASTSLAGQSLLRPVNELARKVGTNEARVTMRKSSSSTSFWYAATLL